MAECAAIADEIAPQQCWRSFDPPTDRARFTQAAFPIPAGGVTPEFVNDVSARARGGYGLPLSPTGQGAARDIDTWHRFVAHVYGARCARRLVLALRRHQSGHPPPPRPHAVAQLEGVADGRLRGV
jgi:hypothetical protein